MLYSNFNTISFEDVKLNLLSKEKFDLYIHTDSAERLVVRGKTNERGMVIGVRTVLSLEILKLVRLAIAMVNWVILLLTVGNYKTRGRKKKIILMNLLELHLLNLILMLTCGSLPLLKGEAILNGFLILGVPIICVLTRIGF